MEPIIARLTYPAVKTDRPTASALGIEVKHKTPIFALCRKLVEAGYGDRQLRVVNSETGMPLMEFSMGSRKGGTVIGPATIADTASLTVMENEKVGPAFRKFSPFAISSVDAED